MFLFLCCYLQVHRWLELNIYLYFQSSVWERCRNTANPKTSNTGSSPPTCGLMLGSLSSSTHSLSLSIETHGDVCLWSRKPTVVCVGGGRGEGGTWPSAVLSLWLTSSTWRAPPLALSSRRCLRLPWQGERAVNTHTHTHTHTLTHTLTHTHSHLHLHLHLHSHSHSHTHTHTHTSPFTLRVWTDLLILWDISV